MKTIVWICLVAASLRADSVFTDSSRDGLREFGITLSDGFFTPEHLEQLARAELARTPRATFIKLTMVGSKGGLPLPKAPDAIYSFENWLRFYDEAAATPNEIAEMIAINGDAVLIVRDRSGSLTERILAGRNPLRVTAGGQDLQIVDVILIRAILYGADIRFFLRTTELLRVEAGEKLLEVLQSSAPKFRISATVQNNAWFVGDEYPFFNPLVEQRIEPTKEEYLQTKTLECGYVAESPSCAIHDQKAGR
jgi:hypothetical protein